MIEWGNEGITSEPLAIIVADNPITCTQYAAEHDLLELDGWISFKHITKNQKKMTRMINQAKMRSCRHLPQYMLHFEVLWDYKHALILDKRN